MFTPDPNFFHSGSRIRIFSIPDPHKRILSRYFNPKKLFLNYRKYDIGSYRIRILNFLLIPDPGSGVYGSATLIGSSTVHNKYNYFLEGTWLLFRWRRRADPQLKLLLDSKPAADQRLLPAVAAVASQRSRRNSRPDLDTAILQYTFPPNFKYSFFRSAINQLSKGFLNNQLRYFLRLQVEAVGKGSVGLHR